MTSPSPMADAPKPLTDEALKAMREMLERGGVVVTGEVALSLIAEVTASRAARGEANEAMAKRLGALFVLALQSGDAETREAARVASSELDWAHGYPRFLPALAAAPAPAPAEALIAVPRKLLVRLHVALSEGRDYARNWSAHTGSINGREFSEATLDLDRELRALTASTAAAGEKDNG